MVLLDLVIYDINRRMFFAIYFYFELMPSGELRKLALN